MSGGKILLREKVIRTPNTLARIGAASFLGRPERSEGRHQKDRVESRMKLLRKSRKVDVLIRALSERLEKSID